tara:strand:+ start:26774 stop:27406 length:633 start_codon:yes stop_codon:yes gene_type:complete
VALRLPRFDSSVPLTKDNNTPSIPFHQWWQLVVEAIESAFNQLEDTVVGIQAALDAAGIAQAAAADAQAAATAAQTAADSAEATGSGAERIASLTNSGVTGLTITASDAGSDATVNISSHTRLYGNGDSVSVDGDSVTGLSYSTKYYFYYTDVNRTGGTVTYNYSTVEGDAVQTGDRHFVGVITTPAALGSPSDGFAPRPPGIGQTVDSQ